jgi:hypothetical protein
VHIPGSYNLAAEVELRLFFVPLKTFFCVPGAGRYGNSLPRGNCGRPSLGETMGMEMKRAQRA